MNISYVGPNHAVACDYCVYVWCVMLCVVWCVLTEMGDIVLCDERTKIVLLS